MKQVNQTTSQRVINDGSLASSRTHSSYGSLESSNSLIIGTFYRIGPKIGAGNFGELYLGMNMSNKKMIAIKRERVRSRSLQLHLEKKFYEFLGRKEGIPYVYYFDKGRRYNSLVMELLGSSLEEIFNNTKRKFSVKTTSLIGMQLIRRIQFVHSKGIIYRDIKPENFLIGTLNGTQNIIYIVDFGLAKEYMDPNTKNHIPFSKNRNLTGTARYMSINTHLGYEQSRRDDLESLGHMLLYFLRGALPWQGLKAETIKERYVKIGEVKKNTSLGRLCHGLPDEFVIYMRYARSLDFYQEPDYDYLYNLFDNLLKKMKFENMDFDWNLPDLSYSTLLTTFESEMKLLESPNFETNYHNKDQHRNSQNRERDQNNNNGSSSQKFMNVDFHPLVANKKKDNKVIKPTENCEPKHGIFRCCLPFAKTKEQTGNFESRSKALDESNPM